MAEAMWIEEHSMAPSRFYCHICKVEINTLNTDFTCPTCALGFVEELPATETPAANANGNPPNGVSATPSGSRPQPFAVSHNGANIEISFTQRHEPNLRLPTLNNVLLDFLLHITTDPEDPNFGRTGVVFLGNTDDHVWDREGANTLVLRLLNQPENPGPPPLPKEKIAAIPKVRVTSKEVAGKQQCPVCWEEFQLKQKVRKLPCTHIYHENCIVPWLELHGTCPICRKSLNDANTDAGASGSSTGPIQLINAPTRDELNAIRNSANRRGAGDETTGVFGGPPSTANEHRQRPGQQPNRPNNVFGFDTDNIDLD